jgi:hypothetical protein
MYEVYNSSKFHSHLYSRNLPLKCESVKNTSQTFMDFNPNVGFSLSNPLIHYQMKLTPSIYSHPPLRTILVHYNSATGTSAHPMGKYLKYLLLISALEK